MNRYRRLLLLLGLLLTGLLLLSGSAVAQTDINVSREVVARTVRPSEQRAALRFWTRERIAATEPLALPVDRGAPEDQSAAALSFDGPLGAVAAGMAAPDANDIARAAYPQDWATLDADDPLLAPETRAPDGTSQVFTSYIANYNSPIWKMYPHIWVGRLSFSTAQGTSYCSATSISGNTIVTAAHCVYDTTNNVWYNNWVFTPAYRNGSAPYGTFAAQTCWVLTNWVNLTGSYSISTWARHDVAVCKMGNNSAGQTLNGAVGWAGRLWNAGNVHHFHNLGYPFRDYNNALLTNAGKYLRLCAAESALYTTDTLRTGCDYGPGISGGPWLKGYAPFVVQGQVNSVNSGLFIGTKNLYGARFNSSNIVPLCTAAGC